jgi:hypothetical protein
MNQVGVFRLFKLGRLSGENFDPTIKVLERDLHVVHHEYAEKINAQSNINGLLYEEDVKATKLYWEKKPYKTVKEYVAFEEVKDVEMTTSSEIEKLRGEYLELSGKKAHHLWKEEKLIELIDELKK